MEAEKTKESKRPWDLKPKSHMLYYKCISHGNKKCIKWFIFHIVYCPCVFNNIHNKSYRVITILKTNHPLYAEDANILFYFYHLEEDANISPLCAEGCKYFTSTIFHLSVRRMQIFYFTSTTWRRMQIFHLYYPHHIYISHISLWLFAPFIKYFNFDSIWRMQIFSFACRIDSMWDNF